MDNNPTPLLAWLRAASPEQRERLATLADTKVGYLYLIATCARPNTGAAKAVAIEDATRWLHEETAGALPIVTVRTLATMCSIKGLQDSQGDGTPNGDKV